MLLGHKAIDVVIRLSSYSEFMNINARGGVTIINLNDKSVKVPTMVERYGTVLYLIIPLCCSYVCSLIIHMFKGEAAPWDIFFVLFWREILLLCCCSTLEYWT